MNKKSCEELASVAVLNFPDINSALSDIGITFELGNEKFVIGKMRKIVKSAAIDGIAIKKKTVIVAVQNLVRAQDDIEKAANDEEKQFARVTKARAGARLFGLLYDETGSDTMTNRLWGKLLERSEELAKTNDTHKDHLKILKNTYNYHAKKNEINNI